MSAVAGKLSSPGSNTEQNLDLNMDDDPMKNLLQEIVNCGERARANIEQGEWSRAERLLTVMQKLTNTYGRLLRMQAEVQA